MGVRVSSVGPIGINMYYEWPDGTWCERNELEEYLAFMSDDYTRVKELPDEE